MTPYTPQQLDEAASDMARYVRKREAGNEPYDLDCEEALLGALLLESYSPSGGILSTLTPNDFYRPANRLLFEAMLALRAKRIPLDTVTVASELKMKDQLDAVGGVAYLGHCISVCPTSFHARYYANILVRWAEERAKAIGAARLTPRINARATYSGLPD